MNDKVRKQILAIRDTGLTNMFDVNAVQHLAFERDFYELVCWLEEDQKEYVHFILYGDGQGVDRNGYDSNSPSDKGADGVKQRVNE